ncbi:hypothetical protein OBBRIDRAFT_553310 [Obba rivulosa]|uniref:Velvet domain-containing protein n=1 Tax=Obba rivulosa TaxID=1052685 RepID=A0A8E2AXK4_9APHY|nr:hypothetical protein OBBRIDRAFT_553310 [Obba rivulosa]
MLHGSARPRPGSRDGSSSQSQRYVTSAFLTSLPPSLSPPTKLSRIPKPYSRRSIRFSDKSRLPDSILSPSSTSLKSSPLLDERSSLHSGPSIAALFPIFSEEQTRSYQLEIVQHPTSSAEFGNSTLSRLPLAPPLIAQLFILDQSGQSVINEFDLPFLLAQLSLLPEHGPEPVDSAAIGGGRARRLLYGNLVASPHILRNLQGKQGIYFLFPDVSVRCCGRYRLNVTLLEIPRTVLEDVNSPQRPPQPHGTALAQACSLPFDVLPRAQYVAPGEVLRSVPKSHLIITIANRMGSSANAANSVLHSPRG